MKRMINRAMPVIISTLLVQVFTFLLPIHAGAASCTSTIRKRNSSSIACSHKLQRSFISNTKSSNVYSNSERSTTSAISVLRGGDIISTTTTTTATVNSILYGLDVFGTVIFAFSGALKAGRKGMILSYLTFFLVLRDRIRLNLFLLSTVRDHSSPYPFLFFVIGRCFRNGPGRNDDYSINHCRGRWNIARCSYDGSGVGDGDLLRQ